MCPKTWARYGVLVPLYVYPALNAWEPLIQAITSFPNLLFTVIVNPHNGPGGHSVPDANYIRELPRLAAFDNVQLLGYVHVTYTKRDLGQVLQDVAVYSAWAESSGVGGLAVNGIFVDETPNSFDAISEQYLGQLGQKIKASSGLGPQNIVMHNPGSIPDAAFRKHADKTVIFEDTIQVFWQRQRSGLFEAVGPLDDLACIVHSIPSNAAHSDLQALLGAICRLTDTISLVSADEGDYVHFGPRWQEFIALVDSQRG